MSLVKRIFIVFISLLFIGGLFFAFIKYRSAVLVNHENEKSLTNIQCIITKTSFSEKLTEEMQTWNSDNSYARNVAAYYSMNKHAAEYFVSHYNEYSIYLLRCKIINNSNVDMNEVNAILKNSQGDNFFLEGSSLHEWPFTVKSGNTYTSELKILVHKSSFYSKEIDQQIRKIKITIEYDYINLLDKKHMYKKESAFLFK